MEWSLAEQQAIVACVGDVVDEEGDGTFQSIISNVHKEGKAAAAPRRARRLPLPGDAPRDHLPVRGRAPRDADPTLFFNNVRAATALDPALHEQAARATATFTARFQGPESWPGDVHPLTPRWAHTPLFPDPISGKPALIVDEMFCGQVSDVPDEAAFRSQVAEVLYGPDNLYEHHWRLHDLVVWNNIATQHARREFTGAGARTLRRVVAAPPGTGTRWQAAVDEVRSVRRQITAATT